MTLVNLTGNVTDLADSGFDARRTKVWLEASTPFVVDETDNKVRLGPASATVADDGSFTFTDLLATNSTGINPTSFQYRLWVDYAKTGGDRSRVRQDFGWFSLTATTDLTDVVAEQYVPPTFASTFTEQMEDIRDEAEAARDEAQALVLSDLGTTDGQTRALIENPASQTFGALSSAFTPKVDLTFQRAKPFVIAHRGGHLIHGEHSLEAYNACAEAGFAIEPDIQILSDGGLACIHDSTTTRTMMQVAGTPQATVANITSAQFVRDYVILPEVKGGDYGRPLLFEQLLDLHGGRVLIVPEMKDVATREAVVAAIVERGLQDAVLCQSFNFDDVAYSASNGIPSMWLTDSGDPAVAAANSIGYIGVSTSATAPYVASVRAAGPEVIRWTVNSRTDADTYLAGDESGFFSDDPWWTSGRFERSYVDPFRKRIPWPHMVTNGTRSEVAFANGGVGRIVGTTGNVFLAQDWCPPIASGKARIYFTIDFLPYASAQDRWVSVAFGQIPAEAAYLDAATTGQNAFHCLTRRNGDYAVFENTTASGGVVSRATTAAADIVATGKPGTVRMMFERTATNVTLTNLDTGDTTTYADATVYANSRFTFGFNGLDAIVRNVIVTPL